MRNWFKTNTYEHFQTPEKRSDVYKFCKGLAEYLEKNDVPNILFIDRSARPAWIGVDEYWNQEFPEKKKPGFYFINPDGFNPRLVSMPEAQFDPLLRDFVKQLRIPILGGNGEDERVVDAIVEGFEQTFIRLSLQKDRPLVVFDTCAHTGNTIEMVRAILERVGFTDIRVITANSPDPDSFINPAARLDRYTRLQTCYPFGRDDLVTKGTDVVSERATPHPNSSGIKIRKELRQIIRKKGK